MFSLVVESTALVRTFSVRPRSSMQLAPAASRTRGIAGGHSTQSLRTRGKRNSAVAALDCKNIR
jgi:hypothetical protein